MTNKERMNQIFEAMADITLARLNKIKEAETVPVEDELDMVSATLNLYMNITDNPEPSLFGASEPIVTADEKELEHHDFIPTDSDGTTYSFLSSSIACPTTNHESVQ